MHTHTRVRQFTSLNVNYKYAYASHTTWHRIEFFFWIKTKPAAAAVDAFIVLLKLNLNSTQLLLNDFVRVPNPNRALCVYAYVETMETLIITYC